MRHHYLFLFLLSAAANAQPSPPSFCFVLAEDRGALRPISVPVYALQTGQERVYYEGYNGSFLDAPRTFELHGGRYFRDTTSAWVYFRPIEQLENSHVLVIAGSDTMRVDLPTDPLKLWGPEMARSGSRDSPDVIRFKKGRFAMEDLISGPWAQRAANRIDARKRAEERQEMEHARRSDERMRHQQERERQRAEAAKAQEPSPVPVPEVPSVPPSTIVRADIVHQSADTLWLEITGGVLLTGGCASNMPIFGMEKFIHGDWAEFLPLELTQLDCGMATALWTDHRVMLPLRWWVTARQLVPGQVFDEGGYRLVLVGPNGVERITEPFLIQ